MSKDVKDVKIEKKLTRSFFTVSMITAIAAVVGLIALIVISERYSLALENYGFAQGDIGRAMFEFSDTRSALRAAIGYDEEEQIQKVVQQHAEGKIAFEEALAQVENTIVTDEARATYNSIKEELKEYWEIDSRVMELGATTDRELCKQAQEIAATELSNAYHKIYDQLEELLAVKVQKGNSLSSLLSIISNILAVAIVVVIAVAMVISMRIGRKIASGIAEPLKELGKRLETFAEGDLGSPFPEIKSGDEVEDMGDHAVHMAENLTEIIRDMGELLGGMAGGDYTVRSSNADRYTGDFEKMFKSMTGLRSQMTETLTSIGEASNQVQAGSGNLAEASQCLAEGATEQAGAVEELQATISNITETMRKSAESAEQSYLKAQQYANEADKSREDMKYMMAAMERINDSSNKIGNITAEIESIASQTNLLSLNASIEAARAGESGRGFAVVADQIRELADQSAKAAGDTRELIEGSIREVTEGNRAAERASESLLSVVDGIKQIADFSKNLKVMVEDQAEAMRQAEQGVDQISEVVQSNAATAEEASATSEELSAQSITLDELVGQFKLGG